MDPPSKLNKTQYLLTGAKFEFAVKTKQKILGGKGPLTVPRQLGFWPVGPKPKLPPLGRRLEVLIWGKGNFFAFTENSNFAPVRRYWVLFNFEGGWGLTIHKVIQTKTHMINFPRLLNWTCWGRNICSFFKFCVTLPSGVLLLNDQIA